ncbi:hypothetical protein Athai_28720 [Actinocatenispora thailandica]|uniref:Uncharacterized protein n=1 Tax=Actinocatenispora thailandica TaxID=227318 RepID=A0A7R7DPF1_9ACTN|nr:DUF6069 family protein [Actinocatenispora thailandica]BCJ35369.1 hypothetical protein Athai_28720 [Actinocatenispora thailandica]
MASTARPTRARALTVAAAVVAAVLGWALCGPVAGIDLTVTVGAGRQRVGAGAVVVATLVVGLAGWGLRALLDRLTARARTVWTVLAGIVLLLSLSGPVGSAADGGAVAALVGLHLLVGLVLLVGLRAAGRTPA